MMPGFATNIAKCITKRSFKGFYKRKMFPDIMEFKDQKSGEFVTAYTKKPKKYSSFTNHYGSRIFIKKGKAKNIELEAKVLNYFLGIRPIKVIALPEVKDSPFGYELRLNQSPYKDLESLIVRFLGKSFPKYIEEYLKEYVIQIAKVHAYGPLSFLNENNDLISEENYYNRFSNLINKRYNISKKRHPEILECYKTIAKTLGDSKIKTFVKDARLKNVLSSVFKQNKKSCSLFAKYTNVKNILEDAVFSYISILNKKGRKAILEDERLRNTLFLYLSILNNKKSKTIHLPVDKIFKKSVPLDLSVLNKRYRYKGIFIDYEKLKTVLSLCLQILKEYEQHPFDKKYITIDKRYILEKGISCLIDFDPKHLRFAPPQHDISKMLLFSVKDRKKFLDTYIRTYNSDVKLYNHQYSEYGIKPEIKDKEEFDFVLLNSIIDYALFCMVEKKYKPSSKFYKSQIENAIYALDELKNNWQTKYTKKDFENLDYIKTFLSKGI